MAKSTTATKKDTRLSRSNPDPGKVSCEQIESEFIPGSRASSSAANAKNHPARAKEPTRLNALSDAQCRNAKPHEKPYKLTDPATRGLYLWVAPNGSKTWRRRVYIGGKETIATLGTYPAMNLTAARASANVTKEKAAEGITPVQAKQAEAMAKRAALKDTFEAVAFQFMNHRRPHVEPETVADMETRFRGYLFPKIGGVPIADIEAPAMLQHLLDIARDSAFMARKQRADASRVFRYGMVTGVCKADPAAAVTDMLPSPKTEHRARLPLEAMGQFYKRMNASNMGASTKAAFRLLILTATRPSETAGARWEEVDFERATWIIPAERTKKRRAHVVPLSNQALDVLEAQYSLSGNLEHVFPNIRKPGKPIWTESLIAALRRMEYEAHEVTSHGFRGTFSTAMHEAGWRTELIEAQLAHLDTDSTRRSYNAAQYLKERRGLLQAWGDMLEALEQEAYGGAR